MTLLDIQGDLFASGAPAIGHGVNIDAMMGGGVAALVRERFPNVNEEYEEACRASDLKVGEVQPVLTETASGEPLYILNMATQDRPGASANLHWITTATEDALHFCRERFYSRLAVPRLGSGIGGLDWDTQVRPTLLDVANRNPDVDLAVYFL